MSQTVRSSCEVIRPPDLQHLQIYRDENYVANWPFTGGMWRFHDGEIAVGFTRLKADGPRSTDHLHLDTWGELCLVRSGDDGETWGEPDVVLRKREAAIAFFQDGVGSLNPKALDFSSPETVLMGNYLGEHLWAKTYDEVRFWPVLLGSPDRGHSWTMGPMVKKPRHYFSAWGTPSHIVRPNGSVLVFSDCKPGDDPGGDMHIFADILEPRPDGRLDWHFHGILPLERRDATLIIHPSVVQIGDGSLLLAARAQTADRIVYVMLYRSDDWGRNWYTVGRVTDVGGTPCLLRLADGRLALTYERRQAPKGMRARISEDTQGWRWGPELVLREDGYGDHGYPRSVQRADGSILTAYYYSLAGETEGAVYAPVRHIAGTIWRPDAG